MSGKKIIVIIISVMSFFLSSLALAQDNQGAWWINMGAGYGYFNFDDQPNFSGHDSGLAVGLGLNYMTRSNQLLTVRADEIFGIGSAIGAVTACIFSTQCDTSGAKVVDLSALYGLIHKGRDGYISASAGLGVVRASPPIIIVDGVNLIGYNPKRYTLGFPLEVQAFWTPSRHFGIGIIGFGSVTSHYSNVGALLAIQFGRLLT